jgi:hypothetical protein
MSELTNYGGPIGNWTGYTPYAAAAAAAPFVNQFAGQAGQVAMSGVNKLQQAYRNYQNGYGVQTAVQSGPAGTVPPAGVTVPTSYMPAQPTGVPGRAAAVSPGPSGGAFQPGGRNPHAINPRSVAHPVNAAMPANIISFSDLINMDFDGFARLSPPNQRAVDKAIMDASSGFHGREGKELGRFFLQYSLDPNNVFNPAAARQFMTRLDASFRPYLQNPLTKNFFDIIRPQMNSLADHAGLITRQLKSKFEPIDQRFLREALWKTHQDPLSAVGQPGSFDYNKITAASIHDLAKRLQTDDRIRQGYRSMTHAGIHGTNTPYQNSPDCPDQGLINWASQDLLEWLAPGGHHAERSVSTWWNPGSWWNKKQPYIQYPSGVRNQILNGTVVGVLPGRYTLNGEDWIERQTSPAIQNARETGMENYIRAQREFYQISNGQYSNCRSGDIDNLQYAPPGQVLG